jgi:DNA end-binding protein Ku
VASTVWKGFLTFGLVSIPVKLYRAARPEKVSFRQLHARTGARVRQMLVAPAVDEPEYVEEEEEEAAPLPSRMTSARPERTAALDAAPAAPAKTFTATGGTAPSSRSVPFVVPPAPAPPPIPVSSPEPQEVRRSELVKGYEYARDQYVTVSKEELAQITPETAREMQMLEFVRLQEVDPIYFETSYYVAPDKGGEKAYSLLYEALRQSEFVGVAQIAMHNREHVVIIRPGRRGITLHTMFYEGEIREQDEYHADTSSVNTRELDLALLLVKTLQAPFEPGKYHDTYREKLDALIQAKIAGEETVTSPAPKQAPVVNILEALQRSLEASAGRKPPAVEQSAAPREDSHAPAAPASGSARKRSGGGRSRK